MADRSNYGMIVRGQGRVKGKNIAVGSNSRAGDLREASDRSDDDVLADLLAQARALTAALDEHVTALREASRDLAQEAEPTGRSQRTSKARFTAIIDRLASSVQSLAALSTAVESLRQAIGRIG